jgi:hypothetical protein
VHEVSCRYVFQCARREQREHVYDLHGRCVCERIRCDGMHDMSRRYVLEHRRCKRLHHMSIYVIYKGLSTHINVFATPVTVSVFHYKSSNILNDIKDRSTSSRYRNRGNIKSRQRNPSRLRLCFLQSDLRKSDKSWNLLCHRLRMGCVDDYFVLVGRWRQAPGYNCRSIV